MASRADGHFSGILTSSCDVVWLNTVLYLLLISTFIIALSLEMVGLLLQTTYTIFLPRCLTKDGEPQVFMYDACLIKQFRY